MQNQVIADIEIEDQKIEYYTSVLITQRFNVHHEFAIRIKYDVLEKQGSFSLKNAQKLIGKSAVIKLFQAGVSGDPAYEFRGIVCEITMEQSENFMSDLVLKGYSPTIFLENGATLTSFYQCDLKKIVQKITKPLSNANCTVNLNPKYTKQVKYICQYKESSFHFLNRLSSDFSEWFYYDGKNLNFGKPASSKNIDVTYGEDVANLQFTLRLLPLAFSSYSYVSKDDKLVTTNAPSNVDGLDQYASYVLKESNKIFSDPVNMPSRQRIENKADLDGFVKKQKTALAADLEILTGSSDNPTICIGAIANVQTVSIENNVPTKEDYGKFLITGIDHHIAGNGKYYNTFEAIPSTLDVIPVKNIIMPIAETQIGTVKDNKDPDNIGRVRVQMLWQQPINEMTDWIRVMTPDAGGGKGGAKNRGLVVVPESGDQVLVCFRYNDPDRPFVMGSMFHGKTGGGGGGGNKTKSLTALSGSIVSLEGDTINIIDAKGNKVALDGTGKINVKCTSNITLECGSSKITMDSGGKIEISGTEILVSGTTKATMKSTASFAAEGTSAKVTGATTEINGDTKASLKSGTAVEIGSPSTDIKGDLTLKLEGAATQINGSTTTDIKGGSLMLNC